MMYMLLFHENNQFLLLKNDKGDVMVFDDTEAMGDFIDNHYPDTMFSIIQIPKQQYEAMLAE